MNIRKRHTVESLTTPTRLYDYIHQNFDEFLSRKGVKKALKRNEFKLNSRLASGAEWLNKKDTIEWLEIDHNPPKPYSLDIEIVFEDDHLAVINKPAGIATSGNQHRTIQNAIIGLLKVSTESDKLNWPKPVHRLDNQTSGLLIIAKTSSAIIELSRQFEEKVVQKTYHAIVIGAPQNSGVITEPIDGKEAITEFETIKTVSSLKFGSLSLIKLNPKTGRTHQLRIHLSNLGFPILGDKLYCKDKPLLHGKGLFLCSNKVSIKHPTNEEVLSLSIDIPYKFEKRLENENIRFEKSKVTRS